MEFVDIEQFSQDVTNLTKDFEIIKKYADDILKKEAINKNTIVKKGLEGIASSLNKVKESVILLGKLSNEFPKNPSEEDLTKFVNVLKGNMPSEEAQKEIEKRMREVGI